MTDKLYREVPPFFNLERQWPLEKLDMWMDDSSQASSEGCSKAAFQILSLE